MLNTRPSVIRRLIVISATAALFPIITVAQESSGRTGEISGNSRDDDASVSALMDVFDGMYSSRICKEEKRGAFGDTAKELRRNSHLPASSRLELAALSDYLLEDDSDSVGSSGLSPTKRASIAQSLISEFPGEPDAFVGLLRAAESESDSELANEWSREILDSDAAPDWLRDRAQCVLDRNDLAGLSLSSLVGDLWPEAKASDAKVIVYSWSSERVVELSLRSGALDRVADTEDAVVLGICLDEDVDEARKTASRLGLPGAQLYWDSTDAEIVRARLRCNQPFLLYSCDGLGIIRSVLSLQ